jgi:hypothetical protein
VPNACVVVVWGCIRRGEPAWSDGAGEGGGIASKGVEGDPASALRLGSSVGVVVACDNVVIDPPRVYAASPDPDPDESEFEWPLDCLLLLLRP